MELNRIHLDMVQLKQTHTSQMDKMKSNFDAKLLYEFQKYDSLQKEMQDLKLLDKQLQKRPSQL